MEIKEPRQHILALNLAICVNNPFLKENNWEPTGTVAAPAPAFSFYCLRLHDLLENVLPFQNRSN